jgi:hypothetical protein
MSYRSRPTALALTALTVLTAACVRTSTNPVTGRMDVDVESPLKKGEDWKGTVTGMGQFAQATGTASAAVLNGQTSISLRVNGLRPGGQHPWRVNEGACGTTGALFGDASLYGTIQVSEQGVAEGSARVGGSLNEAKRYQVRLLASPVDTATVVACANLKD